MDKQIVTNRLKEMYPSQIDVNLSEFRDVLTSINIFL
jgi:hypothetical protein